MHHIHRSLALILALVLALTAFAYPVFAANESLEIKDNLYSEDIGLRVKLSATVDHPETAFRVTGPEGDVTIASVTPDKYNIYTITFAEPLKRYHDYTIHCLDAQSPPVRPQLLFHRGIREPVYLHRE